MIGKLTLGCDLLTLDFHQALDLLPQSLVLRHEALEKDIKLFEAVLVLLLFVCHGFEHLIIHPKAIVEALRDLFGCEFW